MTDMAIGGYFELELPLKKQTLYAQAKRYQSARAAFLALLRSVKPKRVWMPSYICDSMLAPVLSENIEICYYSIDEKFEIKGTINLQPQDLLLYVNYFGICDDQVLRVLDRFNPQQIVVDCSQAFYAAPKNCLATIYSPRKFFGVPDGGLLVSDCGVAEPEEQDQGSESRMQHLIKRLGSSPEAGYAAFKLAEDSLNDMQPRRMSVLTEKLLSAIDAGAARAARKRNFKSLRDALDSSNTLKIPSLVDGPLCYPYMPQAGVSRELLVKNRIFIATYWPDVLNRVAPDSFEFKLTSQYLPIPCDQRYGERDMKKLYESVLEGS